MKTWLSALILWRTLVPVSAQAQAVNVTGATIRLFEQGSGFVLSEEKRVYTFYFNTLRTRYIDVEATVEYSPVQANLTLAVSCRMTSPDGAVVDGIWKIGVHIAAGSTRAVGANVMFGAGKAGWQPGIYKVTCSSGRPLGETTFQMSKGPSLLADLDLHLKDVQFFLTGSRVTPTAERKYLDRFSQAEATRIGIELSFVHASGRSGEIPIDCSYLTPSGNVFGILNLTYQIDSTATGGNAAMGIGWDQPGRWPTGDYLAICQIHGRPISVDRFTVW